MTDLGGDRNCSLPLASQLLGMRDALGFLTGNEVEAHEVGGTGGLARTGNDSEDVSGFDQAAADEILLGHGDHLLRGPSLAATHGMDSPVKIHALHYGLHVREGVDGGFRTVLRNHAGGVAGLGEDGDCAHGQIFGGVGDRLADGFGDGEAVVLAAAAELDEVSHIAFGFDDDARHDRDRFARILAAGSFGGEHDGVAAVEDGVGYIAGLGARGARVLDHRFEHLRSGDDRLSPGGGTPDDVLLNDGNFFRRDFHAKVAAGDHDSVGRFKNFLQMIDGLRLLEFGDDGNVAAMLGDDLLYGANVGSGTDERQGDRVNAMGEAEFEILAVFVGERRDGESDAGKIDAFVLAQHAAVENVAEHVFAAHTAHAQFNEAVAEQDTRAGREFAGEIGESR